MGLSLKETEKLLHFVDGIRSAGKSAIFIDHNIFHVYSVADRIVVLDRGTRRGRVPDLALLARGAHGRSCARSPRPGAYTEAERYRPAGVARASRRPRGQRERGRDAAAMRRDGTGIRSRRLGVADRHHRRVPAAVADVHRPRARGRSCTAAIYLSFAQTTPYFAIVAMPLTMVIVAGDIDLSFPSIMALGHGRLRRSCGRRPAASSWASSAALGGRCRWPACSTGSDRHVHRHPVAGRDDRHPVPLPRPDARPRRRQELRPRRDPGRRRRTTCWSASSFGIPMEFYWLVLVTVVDVGAAQPAPPRPERLRHRRQPPGGRR